MKTLSIVFQGPVLRNGELCSQIESNILRTRTAFPQSEIIVSTWHTTPDRERCLIQQMDKINVTVVLSPDPGALVGSDSSGEWISNINRLLLSSQAGLQVATRPLSVKLRTDTCLYGREIVSLLERYVLNEGGPARDGSYRVFTKRVINASWFARDAEGSLPYLFHPGDIFLAGLTEDIRLFFSAPLADINLFSPSDMPGLWSAWRYVPEQWFWIHAIHKVTGKMEYAGNFSYTPEHIEASGRYFLANFVPFAPRILNLQWKKYWRRYPFRGLFSVYSHDRWLRLASRHEGINIGGLSALVDRVFTGLWRGGYILRARLIRFPLIRRLARKLFIYRRGGGGQHQHEQS